MTARETSEARPERRGREKYLGRGLLVLIAVAALGLVAVAGAGYHWFGGDPGDRHLHLLLALIASLLLLFAQSWILIYLAGTGRLIGKTAAEGGLDPAANAEARRLRRRALPFLVLAALSVLAAFLSGALAMVGLISNELHGAFFFVALVAQAGALWAARPALAETERRIRAIDREVTALASPAPPTTPAMPASPEATA